MDDDDIDDINDSDDEDRGENNNPGNGSSSGGGAGNIDDGNDNNNNDDDIHKEEDTEEPNENAADGSHKVGTIKVIEENKLKGEEDEEEIEEIPMDKENPKRCVECGNEFDNHFLLKTHYQSEHLKLSHRCTIEGCNAGFPSKRSRDRHAANLNLHRKLLSTDHHQPIQSDNTDYSQDLLARLSAAAAAASHNKPPDRVSGHVSGIFKFRRYDE